VTVGATPKAGEKTSEMVHDLTEIALGQWGPLAGCSGSRARRVPPRPVADSAVAPEPPRCYD
jgi:hypothetical protein